MATMTYTGTLVVTSCWCGIRLAIPKALFDEAHRKVMDVYCPLGHVFVWRETNEKRLERQLKAAEDQAFAERARADQAERSRRAWKGQATRARRQVLAGECPICGVHLRDLERHIGRMHKDESAEIRESDLPVE